MSEFDFAEHGFDRFDEASLRHAEEMEQNRIIAPELTGEIDRLDEFGQQQIERRREEDPK